MSTLTPAQIARLRTISDLCSDEGMTRLTNSAGLARGLIRRGLVCVRLGWLGVYGVPRYSLTFAGRALLAA